MYRRAVIKLTVGAALALSFGLSTAQAADDIKIGVVGPKTGPMAGGATVTHFPPYRLWAQKVNARGGLNVKGQKRKIKLIEYDDKTNPGETIKAVQRLINQDKADFIVGPYGTGFNIATAPIFAKHGYPQFAIAAVTDQVDKLIKRFPTIFFFLGNTTSYTVSVAEILAKMVKEGKINNRVAMANVGDTFGIELANAARKVFKKYGLNIVYDKSYPLGTQDLTPVIKAAKAAKPDSFIAWSYPPDTFGMAKAAKIEKLDVKVYYSAVATAFPAFSKVFGKSAENVLGAGGVAVTPGFQAWANEHKEATGKAADFWGSALYGAVTEVLEETIEAVGVDRKAMLKYLTSKKFNTKVFGEVDLRSRDLPVFWTVGQWQDGKFVGVKGFGTSGEKEVRIKTGW